MTGYFLKAWLWIKGILLAAVLLYLIVFIIKNNKDPVPVWLWINYELTVSPLNLILTSLALGMVVTLLVRTVVTTIRQIRESRARTRSARLEKEVAEMRAKAEMLQKRETAPAISNTHTSDSGERL